MPASSTRERYIDAGFITPCPYRNRPKLTVDQMLEQGFWTAAKAKAKVKREATDAE